MKIEFREATKEGVTVTVIDIVGDLDARTAPDFKDQLKDVVESGKVNLIINLEQVSYMDSAGLGVLVSGLKNANRASGDLKIVGMQTDVRNIFELTRLNQVFSIFDSEDDALASFA
jgi:anti-sigma B factor antagonist